MRHSIFTALRGVRLPARGFFLALALLLGGVPPATADTIVLKNGRRIVALSVVEEGDKVKYQTPAGELSLPKSIVDHIERGGAVPMPDSPAEAAANLKITPPRRRNRPRVPCQGRKRRAFRLGGSK